MPVFQLSDEILFPDPAYAEEDGLLAIGGDLSSERLLAAYSHGIFPWYSDPEPILWWSPDPRLVLFPERHIVSKSLLRKIRNHVFEVRFDTCFEEIVSCCSSVERKHEDGTWITPEIKAAYCDLHEKGLAHSVETFYHGRLAGGLYGVSLGRAFFGESMFHSIPDASKVALFYLVEKAKESGWFFIDSQVETNHMIRLGAELISRDEYLRLLSKATGYRPVIGKWGEM